MGETIRIKGETHGLRYSLHNAIAHCLPTNTQVVLKPSATLSQLPQFYCSSQCHTVWNTPLYSLDKLSWFCPISVSCDTCLLALRALQAVEKFLTYYKNYSSWTKESEFQNHQNFRIIRIHSSLVWVIFIVIPLKWHIASRSMRSWNVLDSAQEMLSYN